MLSKSDLRRERYKQIFNCMNDTTNETRTNPLSFEKSSATRWLRRKVMYNILVNWEELKGYFSVYEKATTRLDAKYRARHIKEMLLEGCNLLYFMFATPIV